MCSYYPPGRLRYAPKLWCKQITMIRYGFFRVKRPLTTIKLNANATLISRFFMVILDQCQWRPGSCPPRELSVREQWGICEWGFCQIVTRNIFYRNVVWPAIYWTTLHPKRKATSEKLRFFWGRVTLLFLIPFRWARWTQRREEHCTYNYSGSNCKKNHMCFENTQHRSPTIHIWCRIYYYF